MSSWECGVCGYIEKEGGPPEKCPVCEAPKKMFAEVTVKLEKTENTTDESAKVKKYRCSVCGHVYTGTEPPEKCPVCDAPGQMFEDILEERKDLQEVSSSGGKKWYCTVCGYIHVGEEPPEKCPVCGALKVYFVELGADGKPLGQPDIAGSSTGLLPDDAGREKSKKKTLSLLDRFVGFSQKMHLHPITVHFPNGILPAVLVFLGLGLYFNIVVLETVAYYNLIFVLLALPIVLLTGYFEWQKRYKGIKTAVFITKIICGLVVLCSVNILVFWRLLDPAVLAEASPYRLIYLGVAGIMVAAAGISGHLGGKLVFASRG